MAHITLNEGATSMAAANWSNAAGFADAADMGIPFQCAVTSGLDTRGSTTNGIDSLSITGKGAKVGSSVAYLQYETDATPTASTNLTVKFAEAWLDVTNTMVKAEFGIGCKVNLTGTTITTVRQTGGTVLGNGTTVFVNPTLKGGDMSLLSGGTAPTTFVADGGTALVERGGTTLTVGGGAVVTIDATSATWTTVNVEPGGKIIWLSGTITTLNISGGIFDASLLTAKYTITTSNLEALGTLIKSPLLTIINENTPDSGGTVIVAGSGS